MTPLQAARLIAADYAGGEGLRAVYEVSGLGVNARLYDTPHGLVLICQGSVQASDWFRNLTCRPETGAGASGLWWHRGFLGEARLVWAGMQHFRPRWVLGHSRGAGVAQPLGIGFMARDPECRCLMFAAPRCVARGPSHGGIPRGQIFNLPNDPVPMVPPWLDFWGEVTRLPVVRWPLSHRIGWYIKALEAQAA